VGSRTLTASFLPLPLPLPLLLREPWELLEEDRAAKFFLAFGGPFGPDLKRDKADDLPLLNVLTLPREPSLEPFDELRLELFEVDDALEATPCKLRPFSMICRKKSCKFESPSGFSSSLIIGSCLIICLPFL